MSHSGSTAGYQAFLTRFPDQRLSVAVLCNVSNAQATQYAHAVADLYLGDRLKPAAPVTSTHTLTGGEGDRFVGQWIGSTGVPFTIAKDKDGLRLGRSTRLFAISPMALITADRDEWQLDAYGVRHTDPFGTIEELRREGTIDTIKDPGVYAGTFGRGKLRRGKRCVLAPRVRGKEFNRPERSAGIAHVAPTDSRVRAGVRG